MDRIYGIDLGDTNSYIVCGNENEDVVVVCPSVFNGEAKMRLLKACEIAGFKNIKLLPDSIAVFWSYCSNIDYNCRVIVYDLGVRTFNLTLVEYFAKTNSATIVDVLIDDRLGGIDWDVSIYEYIVEMYCDEMGLNESDISPELREIIYTEVKNTKKIISKIGVKGINIRCDGDITRVKITNSEFNKRTESLIGQTIKYIYEILEKNKLDLNDIDMILLSGGSTRVSGIKKKLEELFPNKVRLDEPELAKARGAAIWGCRVETNKKQITSLSSNVNYHKHFEGNEGVKMNIDFFEITGLSFDPPEKSGKKVKDAIEKAEKSLVGMLGSVSQQAQREKINGKLFLLTRLKTEVLTSDCKITGCFVDLAKEKLNATKKRIDALVRLEKISQNELVVTSGKIKLLGKKTHLSRGSIEEVYKSHGFTVVDIDPLAAFPKFPTNLEKIVSELEILRGSKDLNPNGADLKIVHNLYDFVAYLRGEPENALEYRGMPTKDIALILDEYATKNAVRNDSLGKLCTSIANAGKYYVFNNEENRKAYEQFLLYKSMELTKLFSIMHDALESDLRDPRFADVCIQEITKVFGDSDVALAIYNYEAGLRDVPYIPEKVSFSRNNQKSGLFNKNEERIREIVREEIKRYLIDSLQ